MGNPTLPRETKQKSRRRSAASSTKPRVSRCDDLTVLISKRAYELYSERGYRHGSALDDWLEAEREILSQIPPV
jgi:hypothetical protein